MITIRCGNTAPDDRLVVCDRPKGMHRLCSGFSEELDSYIDWANPAYEDAKVGSKGAADAVVRAAASRVTGVEGAELAAGRWSEVERVLVLDAIRKLAEERESFTADDVWAELGDTVPMTSGLAAMFRRAVGQGIIEPTERYADSSRTGRADNDSGRRLRVWRGLSS
jgi:hypothetical protein